MQAINHRVQARKMAARLRRDREEQRFQATRMRVIESLTQADIAAPLRALEDQIGIQRMKCKRLQRAAWHAGYAFDQAGRGLEEADRECQSAFAALHLLEAFERALHEDVPAVAEIEGNPDFCLVEMMDEEIEERANELIQHAYVEKLRELEEQIAAIQWP